MVIEIRKIHLLKTDIKVQNQMLLFLKTTNKHIKEILVV